MSNIYNASRRASATLIGIVIYMAGFFKLMDPVGTSLIVEDYSKFFALPFIAYTAKPVAVTLSIFETLLGAALITGVWRRITAFASGIVLAAFTVVTAILAIKNPSMDCGCFGQAIHLTHIQSLIKNGILLLLWCYAFLPFRDFGQTKKIKYITFSIAGLSSVIFAIYSLYSVPLMDFTSYNGGAEIQTEDAPLSICTAQREYIDTCCFEGPTMAISIYDTDNYDLAEACAFLDLAGQEGYRTMVLMSCAPDELFSDSDFCADRRTLMSLNRSNAGATFIHNQQIIRKWSANDLPDKEELDELLQKNPTEEMLNHSVRNRLMVQGILLYVFAVMLLL